MLLTDLASAIAGLQLAPSAADADVGEIACDSRAVSVGSIFVALQGTKTDGAAFIPAAQAAGAVAVLADKPLDLPAGMSLLLHANPRRAMGEIAALLYAPAPQHVMAVTGTNGKTSVVHFCRQLWYAYGKKSASIGTLGVFLNEGVKAPFQGPALTTPDSTSLHRVMRRLKHEGIIRVALEASSHGLEQWRMAGLKVNVGAFTNLSRDHLDYHGSMEAYFNAKAMLFEELMPKGGAAVINTDIPEFEELATRAKKAGHKVMGFGMQKGAYVWLKSLTPTSEGQQVELEADGKKHKLLLPLMGQFQASNVACAMAMVMADGVKADEVINALHYVSAVPGRMQKVPGHPRGAAVVVDYAHTPDALEKVLKALRPHTEGKLVALFGCGGDRDRGKRPLMGALGAELADVVVITDDNPRTEDAAAIRAEVAAGLKGKNVEHYEVEGREEAIHKALSMLAAGDVLVLAGKGHETTQTIGTTAHPFDDVEVAARLMKDLK